jgi:virulence-associated protein VapD
MAAKNVFISHVHEDDKLLQDLKDLLARNGYEIRDGSIDSSKPNEAKSEEYIKSQILAPRIEWAATAIVLISPRTHESEYVEWEVEYANKKDKRIVGVWVQGGQDSDVPKSLDDYADAVVGWRADRVMDAITGRINNWYGPDGPERPPREINRYDCGKH